MTTPQVGQRWLVDTDASLGLGIITSRDSRSVVLEFPATGDRRQYAIRNAPLTRAVFSEGETIRTSDGESHEVARVESINDLLIYINHDGDPIPETQLAATIQFNHPAKRLLAAQLDKPDWFSVREALTEGYHHWLSSETIGLVGARITLTPHQLYVAKSATSINPVRVLLADEVGLGKTIEAGLILQRLQCQDRVNRALILVPEALCVQWFVELLRCFSIQSVLVGNEDSLDDSRIFIASHHWLANSDRALSADFWDVVIVDEAHHFDLTEAEGSAQRLKSLAQHCEHMLLLSATPERLGLEKHFLRLQLLDADRYHNFERFQEDYERYQSLADDLQILLDHPESELSPEQQDFLQKHFPIDKSISDKSAAIELLLDSYGTGRVMYRNTRHAVLGFPQRRLCSHEVGDESAKLEWLSAFIKQYSDEKLLLITHEKEDVLNIREWLYRKTGIDCPVFHEDMTLVERDRAAAYFADNEEGAPLLLCSEIGSEGRNFQFCHRLICWDLPDHPDVLEQRIGRLDRIGQTQDIEIHVCVDSEVTATRLHWFHDVLSCIEKINPAAGVIHERWYLAYLDDPKATELTVNEEMGELLAQLEQGRDRLLEMNSCRQPEASRWVEEIQQVEWDNHPQELLESLTDVLNLHYEQLSEDRFRLVPSDQMLVPVIPGIPAEGKEITFDRETATAREDVEFITWDHSLMQGLAELINSSELGVASLALLPNKSLKAGMLFAETLFTVSVQSAQAKQANRYLTQSVIRVVSAVDNPKNLASALPSEQLSQIVETASKAIEKTVISDYRQQITNLAEKAEALAQTECQRVVDQSLEKLAQRQQIEISRLMQLQKNNGDIGDVEIAQCEEHFLQIANAFKTDCQPNLSAIRLLVTYRP